MYVYAILYLYFNVIILGIILFYSLLFINYSIKNINYYYYY